MNLGGSKTPQYLPFKYNFNYEPWIYCLVKKYDVLKLTNNLSLLEPLHLGYLLPCHHGNNPSLGSKCLSVLLSILNPLTSSICFSSPGLQISFPPRLWPSSCFDFLPIQSRCYLHSSIHSTFTENLLEAGSIGSALGIPHFRILTSLITLIIIISWFTDSLSSAPSSIPLHISISTSRLFKAAGKKHAEVWTVTIANCLFGTWGCSATLLSIPALNSHSMGGSSNHGPDPWLYVSRWPVTEKNLCIQARPWINSIHRHWKYSDEHDREGPCSCGSQILEGEKKTNQ